MIGRPNTILRPKPPEAEMSLMHAGAGPKWAQGSRS